jgi:hypothetical protein
MVQSSTIPFPTPTIDPAEARLAADELAALIQRVGPDSVPGLILRQAQQELQSLLRGSPEVVGPVRVRVAA